MTSDTQNAAFSTLRRRFVTLNMVTVSIVIILIFSAIVAISHMSEERSVYESLDEALNRAIVVSMFPTANSEADRERWRQEFPNIDFGEDDVDGGSGTFPLEDLITQPAIGGMHEGHNEAIPVAVFHIHTEPSFLLELEYATASLSDEVLKQATEELSSTTATSGKLSDAGLYYKQREIRGVTYVAFADASLASTWQSLALLLTGIGVLTILVFFVISLYFSAWSLKPVKQAWEKQQQFVSDASHDLKTPLAVISANSAILLEHPEEHIAGMSQWIESTQLETERMQSLVEDMLDLAKLDEGHQIGSFESVDFSTVVIGELLQFESIAWDRHIDLESAITENITVSGDYARLTRLVQTLIDNACKYTGLGGKVTVTLSVIESIAALSVTNTGNPIPAEDLPHVFDRFYRSDKARTTDDAGSHGLGLAIALGIAKEHSGDLTVTSSEEDGTTFTATIPIM